MTRTRTALVLASLALTACSETSYYNPPATAASLRSPDPPAEPEPVAEAPRSHHDSDASIEPATAPLTPAAARIVVYEGKGSPKPSIVVGIIDVHTAATASERAFDELRRRASALGADAVIGAEFHHGDDKEPSHVSGMAIRFRERDESPYDVLGKLDVVAPSGDAAAQQAALAELQRRGAALGADQILAVEFEHGDDGAPSHLRGTAVRHRGMKHAAATW